MKKESWILYMGTYPPRECGIATFTRDVTAAVAKKFPAGFHTKICAMNRNSTNFYNYSKDVLYQLDDANIEDYITAAKKINENEKIKLVNIQHEFGIFGGEYGSYLIPFLEIINKPVVVTFHSVLPTPDPKLRQVVRSIASKVVCIIVMTPKGVEILQQDYGITTTIRVIPHGIPIVPFERSESSRVGYDDRIILSSFGLISPGKGYEHVIDSLPKVIEKYPNILYLILGETHPVVRKEEGESYRNFLEKKVKDLGLQNNVKFYNKYMTLSEIVHYLGATRIYISPGQDQNQITSGTLSYAMGCGRVAISTPFLHAKDLIKEDRGIVLNDFAESGQYSEAILSILNNPIKHREMEKNAYAHSRHMTWPNVALSYIDTFQGYMDQYSPFEERLPKVSLSHLENLTDNFGVIQFANHSKPDVDSGYTLDDNARALIVATMHYNQFRRPQQLDFIKTYLNFIGYVQQGDGKLLNFIDYHNRDKVVEWSDDAHGRALWGLGYLISTPTITEEIKEYAEQIFLKSLKAAEKITSPRAVAYIIMGLYYYTSVKVAPELIDSITTYANHLVSLYYDNVSEEWKWFEGSLTYSNSRLPEGLLFAYLATKQKKYLHVGEKTLRFLSSITFEDGNFSPIGQNGWYVRNGKKARFDQQPVDSAAMVQTLVLAYQITQKKMYKQQATTAFHWFLGNNSLRQVVYDEVTGGCHDGLGEFSVNLNQGAESTISYILARLTLEQLQNTIQQPVLNAPYLMPAFVISLTNLLKFDKV